MSAVFCHWLWIFWGGCHREQGELKTHLGSPHFKPPSCPSLRCHGNSEVKVTHAGTEEMAQWVRGFSISPRTWVQILTPA